VAIKLRIPRKQTNGSSLLVPADPVVRAALLIFVSLSLLVVGFFSYFYVKYDRII